jgi:hypothetical protein
VSCFFFFAKKKIKILFFQSFFSTFKKSNFDYKEKKGFQRLPFFELEFFVSFFQKKKRKTPTQKMESEKKGFYFLFFRKILSFLKLLKIKFFFLCLSFFSKKKRRVEPVFFYFFSIPFFGLNSFSFLFSKKETKNSR